MADPGHPIITRAGIAGGTLTGFIMYVTTEEIIRTIIMTTICAIVSGLVTWALKSMLEKVKKRLPVPS